MKTIRWWLFPLLLILVPFNSSVCAGATATQEVKKVVDQVIAIVADKEMKKPQNEEKRRAALERVIGTIFDYEAMAKSSLGAHWKGRTPAQQKEFVELYRSLLYNSYAGKIESYNNEKIIYQKEKLQGNRAEVRSKVITARREQFQLDYRLHKEGEKWLVDDVVIEGVSLVANYRSQFNRIIRSQGYDELVKKLKTKRQEFKTP